MSIPDEQEVVRVSNLIWERVRAVQAQGVRVSGVRAGRRYDCLSGVYAAGYGAPLCLIGAVIHPYATGASPYNETARILGISVEEARLLEEGFEGWPGPGDHPFFKLGEAIELQLDAERQ